MSDIDIDILTNSLTSLSITGDKKKGSECSKQGALYEHIIHEILKNCTINNKIFNTQTEKQLGGSTNKNDIVCHFERENDIGIEIKKMKTPDWMQLKLIYNKETKKWEGSPKNKIPEKSKNIFEDLIKNITLFNGKIPIFIEKNISHEEWIKMKKESNDFNDMYIDCPNDTILNLYKKKGCNYIQISEKGLYHLGEDICKFDVPLFICEQEVRIRTKIHKKRNTKGFCKLSVMLSCKPKYIKKLENSKYSLDTISKLPINLVYSNLF